MADVRSAETPLTAIASLTLVLNAAVALLGGYAYVRQGNTLPAMPTQIFGSSALLVSVLFLISRSRYSKIVHLAIGSLSLFTLCAAFGSYLASNPQESGSKVLGLILLILASAMTLSISYRLRIMKKKRLQNVFRITNNFLIAALLMILLMMSSRDSSFAERLAEKFCSSLGVVSLVLAAVLQKKVGKNYQKDFSLITKPGQVVFYAASIGIGGCLLHLLLPETRLATEIGSTVCMGFVGVMAFLLFWRDNTETRRGLIDIQSGIISELESVLEHWRALLEQMPDGFFVLDPEYRLLFLNEAGAVMFFGNSKIPEYHGQRMETLFPGFLKSEFAQNYAQVFEKKEAISFDASWGLAEEARNYRGVAYLSGGNISVCVREVTQQRKMASAVLEREARVLEKSKELARSNEDLQHFAYVVSHDLREPLRTITSFGGLLSRRAGPVLKGDSEHYLKEIMSGAHRMRQMIDDLLAYSRIQESPEARRRDVPLTEVLQVVQKNLHAALTESRGKICIQTSLPVLFGDPAQLSQLFQNLIANALKFARPGVPPYIEISSETGSCGTLLMRVRDNGIGIEADHLDRIFAVFQRLHTREEYGGTGIGLAVCKRIVNQAGGRIWAESDGVHGTSFCFTWRHQPGESTTTGKDERLLLEENAIHLTGNAQKSDQIQSANA